MEPRVLPPLQQTFSSEDLHLCRPTALEMAALDFSRKDALCSLVVPFLDLKGTTLFRHQQHVLTHKHLDSDVFIGLGII